MQVFRFVARVYKLVSIKQVLCSEIFYHEHISATCNKMGQERTISHNIRFPQLLDFSTYMIHYKILNVISEGKNLKCVGTCRN